MSRFEAFFLKPSSARPLAWFRVAFGVFATVEFLLLRPNWLDLLGPKGLIQWVIAKEIFSVDGMPHLQALAEWLGGFGISGDTVVLVVCNVYLVAVVAIAFGLWTRRAALVAWLLHLVIWNTGILYGYGVESFTRVCLFYLMFMPASGYASLDALRRGRGVALDSWQPTLAYRVLQIHLCIVYLNSGVAKIQGEEWRTGEAVWRVLSQPDYSGIDMNWLAGFPWIALVLSWSVLLLEIGYPFLIWPRRTRPLFLIGMVGMHVVGIGVFMRLYGFACVMTVMNFGAFGHCTDFRFGFRRAPPLASASPA